MGKYHVQSNVDYAIIQVIEQIMQEHKMKQTEAVQFLLEKGCEKFKEEKHVD